MRVAVIGAGAIGAVIATAAADSGHQVTVCARAPIETLVVVREGEELTPALTLSFTPGDLPPGPFDVVWLAIKATDTASAAPWLEVLCGYDTLVASAQNGLDQEARLAPYVPAGRIVATPAYMAAERLGPGRVRHLAGGLLVAPSDVAPLLTDAVGEGGLKIKATDDMHTETWRKMLGNLVANPMTALTMRRIGVMREPGIADLARAILLEAVAVGRAEGADISEGEVERIVVGTGRYGDETGSSMLYDRLAGRPMEHQFLTGEVVRRGLARGIPVPMNGAVLALLDATDRGRETPVDA
jgi:2-dehydropantoate 2-reductase